VSFEAKQAIAAAVGLVVAAWAGLVLFVTLIWGPILGLWLLVREWRG
jgi:hypothetical protein